MTTTDTPNKPVKKFRVGSVTATVWKQKDGFYTASLERRYKDKEDKWQSTSSFAADDLLVVAKVADMAADWIIDKQSET